MSSLPIAGQTTLEIPTSTEFVNTNTNQWSQCPANSFSLRVGPKYNSTKAKAPSPPALMELVGMDIVNTPSKIDNFGSRVQIPAEWKTPPPGGLPAGVPMLFIVNCQVIYDFIV